MRGYLDGSAGGIPKVAKYLVFFAFWNEKRGKVIDASVYTNDKSPVGKRCSIKF